MDIHKFTDRDLTFAARDFVLDNGGRAKIIKIADGWLLLQFW